MKGKLILEDGTIFEGKAFGYLGDSIGEVVFRISRSINRPIILWSNSNNDLSISRELWNKFRRYGIK